MKNNLSRMTNVARCHVLVGLVTVACSGSSTAPTAPTDHDRPMTVNRDAFTRPRASDGSQKDVTALADWRSSNPAVATVEAGRVSLLDSGELTLSAAYRGAVAQIHVGVTIFGDAPALAPVGGSW